MKNIFYLMVLFSLSALVLPSCGDDEDEHEHNEDVEFEYHAHIMSPDANAKHVGDAIHVHVVFESHAGETVHNISIKIYNKSDDTMIIMDHHEHVHETSGKYEYHADFDLTEANGVDAHTDWVLEAKVWGDGDGKGEVVETREFHVHPM